MRIQDEHLYHGAALNQIAEHESFTAINTLKVKGKTSRSAFKINNEIAVYVKYGSAPKGGFDEYVFNFTTSHLTELADIDALGDTLYLSLVCVRDREICCIPYTLLAEMIDERRTAASRAEDQYQLLVTLKKREAFRIYLNRPGTREQILGEPRKVPRNRFPNVLFP